MYAKLRIFCPLGALRCVVGSTTSSQANTTNNFATSGSSGCIRQFNENVIDLFKRADVGSKVIVQ